MGHGAFKVQLATEAATTILCLTANSKHFTICFHISKCHSILACYYGSHAFSHSRVWFTKVQAETTKNPGTEREKQK